MSISIVGMGMGSTGSLTADAQTAISEADLVIGAERLLQSLSEKCCLNRHIAIQPEDILGIINQNPDKQVCVLMSGDVGFYSGTKKLLDALKGHNVNLIPGISSMQYFAAKLNKPWQDWKLVSAHGKQCDVVSPVRDNAETFFLTGGVLTVRSICQCLTLAGFGHCFVTIGAKLGSSDESIYTSTANDLSVCDHEVLSVMLVDNAMPRKLVSYGFPDEAFIRGKIPMTKSEVRSVVLSKLQLQHTDIIYDIGAGTGSVSVEAALLAKNGHVYAFERELEGCRLIKENALKLGASNITLLEGAAPETFSDLPVPDAAFIGGSGGSLEEILTILLAMNPLIRIVVSAVALETLAKATTAFSRLPFREVEVVQISVSRAKHLGAHHLMIAQNPVFVLSGVGNNA